MEVTFFDFETSGLLESQPSIQLGAASVNDAWEITETFEKKIQFDEALADPKALEMNHYDREVWVRDAAAEPVVVAQFDAFLNRHKSIQMVSKRTERPYNVARLAGYNVQSFDLPRLRKMYGEGRFLPAHPLTLDVLHLALWYFKDKPQPKNYQQTTIMEALGIPFPDAHDALADVRASILLAKALARFA
jgi:DNA polymerase III epsilon subunit-like protein